MKRIRHVVRSVLLAYYLLMVVLTIPLAFDVGGVQCGLEYLLAIFVLYFVLTTLRLAARKLPILGPVALLYYSQHIFMPSILMLFVSRQECHAPTWWRFVLVHLTSVFTVAEGFCLLLLIQAISQTLAWLTAHRLDSWLFVSLVGSGCTITGALYFLYRVYVSPLLLELGNALLLGSFLTVTIGLGLYGIVSGKGSIVESSLLFAYIVRCIYETFPLLLADALLALALVFSHTTSSLRREVSRIPLPGNERILAVLPFLAAALPASLRSVWDFFIRALTKLTTPLVVNLAYRIGVFYAATKIVPLLYHGLPHLPPRTPMLRLRQTLSVSLHTEMGPPRPSRVLRLIYAYAPCIIIAVYTHLMLLYSGELGLELILWNWWDADHAVVVHPWQFWNWVNMATTLLLYMAELSDTSDAAMTSHWVD